MSGEINDNRRARGDAIAQRRQRLLQRILGRVFHECHLEAEIGQRLLDQLGIRDGLLERRQRRIGRVSDDQGEPFPVRILSIRRSGEDGQCDQEDKERTQRSTRAACPSQALRLAAVLHPKIVTLNRPPAIGSAPCDRSIVRAGLRRARLGRLRFGNLHAAAIFQHGAGIAYDRLVHSRLTATYRDRRGYQGSDRSHLCQQKSCHLRSSKPWADNTGRAAPHRNVQRHAGTEDTPTALGSRPKRANAPALAREADLHATDFVENM